IPWTEELHPIPPALGKFVRMVGRKESGRKERRSQRKVEVMLTTVGEHPLLGELASMENMNSYGVRVRTERPWKPDTHVLINSLQGELVRARVIYCQSLDPKSFAVGLEFMPRKARSLFCR